VEVGNGEQLAFTSLHPLLDVPPVAVGAVAVPATARHPVESATFVAGEQVESPLAGAALGYVPKDLTDAPGQVMSRGEIWSRRRDDVLQCEP
jgi:hypothetical protein